MRVPANLLSNASTRQTRMLTISMEIIISFLPHILLIGLFPRHLRKAFFPCFVSLSEINFRKPLSLFFSSLLHPKAYFPPVKITLLQYLPIAFTTAAFHAWQKLFISNRGGMPRSWIASGDIQQAVNKWIPAVQVAHRDPESSSGSLLLNHGQRHRTAFLRVAHQREVRKPSDITSRPSAAYFAATFHASAGGLVWWCNFQQGWHRKRPLMPPILVDHLHQW